MLGGTRNGMEDAHPGLIAAGGLIIAVGGAAEGLIIAVGGAEGLIMAAGDLITFGLIGTAVDDRLQSLAPMAPRFAPTPGGWALWKSPSPSVGLRPATEEVDGPEMEAEACGSGGILTSTTCKLVVTASSAASTCA
mmetsp:Transcript_28081/g.50166  ORF Transcript_28081/g.50166 Transcript_28081/m.50166 type:complete len:136 (-) Transcript_28081:390-797(-)